jgi:Fic family protein
MTSKELQQLFTKIDTQRDEILSRIKSEGNFINLITEKFIADYTWETNAIEGNTLTLDNADYALAGFTISGLSLSHTQDIFNSAEAFYLMMQQARNKAPITESVIKDLHFLVLKNKWLDRGEYRIEQVSIGKHMPPKPIAIPYLMEDLVANYQDTDYYHPIEHAARFHADFEGIHPFIDGNGRTGRLLINLHLLANRYPPICITYKNRMEYYECLEAVQDHKNYAPMVELVADYVSKSLTAIQKQLATEKIAKADLDELIEKVKAIHSTQYPDYPLLSMFKKKAEPNKNPDTPFSRLIAEFSRKTKIPPEDIYQDALYKIIAEEGKARRERENA